MNFLFTTLTVWNSTPTLNREISTSPLKLSAIAMTSMILWCAKILTVDNTNNGFTIAVMLLVEAPIKMWKLDSIYSILQNHTVCTSKGCSLLFGRNGFTKSKVLGGIEVARTSRTREAASNDFTSASLVHVYLLSINSSTTTIRYILLMGFHTPFRCFNNSSPKFKQFKRPI